jgi:quercetin dioxygenase-like cupin family protein
MKILRGREAGTPSEHRTSTFTGDVWADVVLTGVEGAMMNNVFFAPRSRTYWHTHEAGQILQVTAGQGIVCTRDGHSERIRGGDIVWIPAGEEHWHGADTDTYLLHLATSLGTTNWLEEVTDAEYESGART